jgi:hypothetical protein
MSENTLKSKGLCYRCEYRAQFFEEGHAPRFECGEVTSAKSACYMYKPVRPVITDVMDEISDMRPRFSSPMISAREKYIRLAHELELHLHKADDGVALYWGPIEET